MRILCRQKEIVIKFLFILKNKIIYSNGKKMRFMSLNDIPL